MPTSKRPFALYLLCFLHLLLGINGVAGGILLIIAPDGSKLGMTTGWLEQAPFENYLLPGIFLFLVNGLIPLFVMTGLLAKPRWKIVEVLNLYPDRHWAWTFSMYSGIITIGWIAFQELMTSSFWLQPVVILAGLCILICTLAPRVMHYFELKTT